MNNFPVRAFGRGRGRGIKREEINPQLGYPTETSEPALPHRDKFESREQRKNASEALPQPVGCKGGPKSDTNLMSDFVHSRPPGLLTKSGKIGNKITLETNYFKIKKPSDWTIYQYHVDFSPDVSSTLIRQVLLREHRDVLDGYLFDGTILFSATNYEEICNTSCVLELQTKRRNGEDVKITVKRVGIVRASDDQLLQVLNLILRRSMVGLNLQLVNRNYFDPQSKIILDKFRIELWPGYTTSIRQHESDILMCTEIVHKVMRTDSLYHILSKIMCESDDYQAAFKREVIGVYVITDYNNKTYRVDDVNFLESPLSTFNTKDGDISFVEYYKKRYNIKIRDCKQPLLVSCPRDKDIRGGVDKLIMLIPELTRATGLTEKMRSNFPLMKAMSEYTRLTPERRIDRLHKFNQRLQKSEESVKLMNSWNVNVDTSLVVVPGRVLPFEKVVFGNGDHFVCDSRAEWTYKIQKTSMFTHVDIKHWYVIVTRRSVMEAQKFVQLCITAARGMKMHISEPRYQEMSDDRNSSYCHAIDNAITKDPQILMLVLASANEDKYSCIKKRTCVDRPIPSQVVTLRTIAPRQEKSSILLSIATKVVIQMNAKLMGLPWMIELPLRGLMTVGFDVSHSSKDKNKSYGALVATMDMKLSSRYFSSVMEHKKGQEVTNQLSLNMMCALKSYKKEHRVLPERILFYRDGVGDGQLFHVVNSELKSLKDTLDNLYKSEGIATGCRLAFVIVTKRINTRYFANGRNPLPGTVVDDIITLPERYDFYLVSQSVKQGTVSPTNYNVIHDNFGLDADKLQMLSYKMTHLYYNWLGTSRVPSVCQYAHKLAFLVSESIHRAPSAGLENQLYFL